MQISDLKAGDSVVIDINCDGKVPAKLQAVVELTSVGGHCALLKPIRLQDKIAKFSDNLNLTATVIVEGKPVVWRGCNIQFVKYNNSSYHALICKHKGVTINRRGAFRVPVDEYCYVNCGKATVDATCINVSTTGFAFTVGKYDGAKMDYVSCTYHDSLLDVDVTLTGRVVRQEDKGEGRMLFGCRLLSQGKVDKYVSQRQRKLIRTT